MLLNLGPLRLLIISVVLPIQARVPSHLMHFPGRIKLPLKLELHSGFLDFVWRFCIGKPSHNVLGLRERLPGANSHNLRAVSQASCFFRGTISDANSEASLLWGLIIVLLSFFFFPSKHYSLFNTGWNIMLQTPGLQFQMVERVFCQDLGSGIPFVSCSNKYWLSDLQGMHSVLCFSTVIPKH